MADWIKCSERMPDDHATVVVTDGEEIGFMWYCGENRWDGWHAGDRVTKQVTHWMLPALPEDR